ncbi:LytTR family DNA-binding domain-containing protein [Cytophagaceae bacterium DM2B3-1]|uniref:LytTR family DNA-binding domain-containing protein n=1 Tax=Xanthocytophaga flava TaxID=3048013 RepID=A0ABT7CN85_9BACT|nr:LytTR family DNA-binding domain-containing protein [Xanthocytophaga flavus]MDJ1495213.1 LytTR family DNA-binding domain-containing protein [Xanthocytophaga flavus]
MFLKCIAVDDEPLALDILKTYIARLPVLQLIQTFDDAVLAVDFLKQNPVDLLLVDIHMPDLSGLDLVRSLDVMPLIIFTTAHKNYAFEGFELNAVDYLLKPIDFERFAKAIAKTVDYHQYKTRSSGESAEYLYVYSEYRQVRLNLSEIEYIESLEDYIRIHLSGQKPVVTLMTLKKVLEKLPEQQFKRIHRSFVVAIDRVNSIHNRKAILDSGKELPISDSYTGFIQEWKER